MSTRMVAVALVLAIAIAATVAAAVHFRSHVPFAFGLIRASCAPWDGPAVDLRLTTKPAECKRASEPHLDISIWRALPIHAGQKVQFAAGSEAGFASRCAKEGDCQPAESGWIELETFSRGSGARGRYELHFQGGESLQGSFEVKWCEERVICG